MAKRDLRHATLTVKDGHGTPKTSTVQVGTGNITWTENTPMEYEPDRGTISTGTVRKGDEQPVEISVTCNWVNITQASTSWTVYEILKGRQTGAVSTGADACEPYACELHVLFSPPCGSEDDELVVFAELRVEQITFDPQAEPIAFSNS